MKRVVASWTDAYNEFLAEVDRNWDKGPGEVENAVAAVMKKHIGDPDYEKAYERWCDENDIDYELPQDDTSRSSKVLYVIRDSYGNQLSSPNPDDSELWDRVEAMESRGRRGLSVVAYVGD